MLTVATRVRSKRVAARVISAKAAVSTLACGGQTQQPGQPRVSEFAYRVVHNVLTILGWSPLAWNCGALEVDVDGRF